MSYIFGPVPSRRLGFSLGVEVLSSEKLLEIKEFFGANVRLLLNLEEREREHISKTWKRKRK